MSQAPRESDPPSIDFDDDAISSLLDAFVETQTGSIAKRSSRPPDPSDSGALVAQRTVFERTSRPEALPLVGDSPDAKNRRAELLEALAERAVGSASARLLTSAGELREQLGDHEAATRNYGRALSADARDVVVLRALRRLAIQHGDWSAAASALEKEAALELGTTERASALKLLAGVQLSKLDDPAAAEQAAAHAAELRPDDFVARVILASARLVRGDAGRAADALTAAADCWPEAEAEAALLLHAAELLENAGAPEPARSRYSRVLELDPSLLMAHLGLVRTSRAVGENEAAREALLAAAAQVSPPISDALRRTAANISLQSGSPQDAIALLADAQDTVSRWTRAEAAAQCGDTQAMIEALGESGSAQTLEAHTLGAARRARLHAERGEREGFDRASRDAGAEPGLKPYLQACERMLDAGPDDDFSAPRLLETMPSADTSTSSKAIRTDEAAQSRDAGAFVLALEAELEDAAEPLAGGAALAIAEISVACGLLDRRQALLRAEELVPDSPSIRRALLLDDDNAERGALRWADEGKATSGARSAFSFTMAARLAKPASESAIGACEAALSRRDGYLPALWELEDRLGSAEARASSAWRQSLCDPAEAVPSALRASLWSPSPEDRQSYAEATLDRNAPDPLLLEFLLETVGSATEAAAELMELAARRLDLPAYLERAAASYRAAGLEDQAARVLREASETRPEDEMIRVQRKDAELRAAQFARLADGAMSRARNASDDAERLGAFAAMAEVDRLARRDMQSARLSLQSIAELRPDHVPTARALEWDALRENDTERIRSSAHRLLEALAPDSAERLARQRLTLELLRSDPDILQADLDRSLRGIEDTLGADPSLARQVLGAAYARGEHSLSLQALLALQASLDEELERGALALDAARVLQEMGAPQNALEVLDAARSHPLAREIEARLLHAAERWEDAAAVYQDAASRAKDSHRAASLWREAACLFENEIGDQERAIKAWVASANCDIRYLDVYRRLAALYESRGDFDALAILTDSRIDAGADTPTLVGLLVQKARQRRQRGDLEGVIDALRECLELDPHNFAALKELADTQREAEEWQGATEALIRIARLKRSTDEQIWAFTQLATVYDVHLQDLPRAEASLRRVIQLAPAHLETLDRLASLMSRQGKSVEAGRLLEELIRHAGDDAQSRDYRIRLAVAVESAGRSREAEKILEELRSEQPTDPDVILAVADYYGRQGAAPAEAMHLNRALSDLRAAIEADPGSESLWTTLVRVLHRRHGPGPASCGASAAIALGHPASLFEGDVSNHGDALGEAKVPLSKQVDGIVAPDGMPETARRLFALCEHAFDKVLPFDAGAWRLRRPSADHRELVKEAGAVAEVLGISEPRLKVTYVAPAACMPVSGDPPTIVVGGNLQQLTTPRERLFLFARALKVAGNHLAPALRARPQDLDLALLSLIRGHRAGGGEEAATPQMLDLRKKLIKAVPRRSRDEVDSLALELKGNADFSTRATPFAIAELANRAALTLTGDVPSAVNALLKIAGHDIPAGHEGRPSAIQETPEAWAMVRFAISDAHFEARAQAGVDL